MTKGARVQANGAKEQPKAVNETPFTAEEDGAILKIMERSRSEEDIKGRLEVLAKNRNREMPRVNQRAKQLMRLAEEDKKRVRHAALVHSSEKPQGLHQSGRPRQKERRNPLYIAPQPFSK